MFRMNKDSAARYKEAIGRHKPVVFTIGLFAALVLSLALFFIGRGAQGNDAAVASSEVSSAVENGDEGEASATDGENTEGVTSNTAGASRNVDPEAVTVETQGNAIVVETGAEISLMSAQTDGEVLDIIPQGTQLTVVDDGDVLWYLTTLDDGTEGRVYGEDLYPVTDGVTSEESLSAQRIALKLKNLQIQFPDGKFWNHMDRENIAFGTETPFMVSDIPCQHSAFGEVYCNMYNGSTLDLFPQYGYLCQCLGFAALISDQIFGEDAPSYFFYDYDQLRPGDQIRLNEYEHSMIVVSKNDQYVTVAEVNQNYENCLISWGRQITRYSLEYELSWDLEYISRYPQWRAEDGTVEMLVEIQEQPAGSY